MVVLGAGFLLMGVAALVLGLRQRDALYGWFGAAAVLGVVRVIDKTWVDLPVPWPGSAALLSAGYALHLVLTFRVAAMMLGPLPRWLDRLAVATAGTVCALAVAAFLGRMPKL